MAVAVCSGDIVGVEGWKGVGDVGVDVGVGVCDAGMDAGVDSLGRRILERVMQASLLIILRMSVVMSQLANWWLWRLFAWLV